MYAQSVCTEIAGSQISEKLADGRKKEEKQGVFPLNLLLYFLPFLNNDLVPVSS